jgi:general secretion pathway protein J
VRRALIRRGFTLLEVVVALGLMALIGVITFATMSNALTTRAMLEQEDEGNQGARVAMERLRKDLRLAYLTKNTTAVNTYRTQFVGQNKDPDALWFTSLSHHRMYADSRECDQTELTYWVENDPTMDGAWALLRREAPRIDNEPEAGGLIAPLAYHLKSVDFRYMNSKTNEWLDEWDTNGADTPNKLPRAVQILLVFLVPDPDDPDRMSERPFATTVILHFADRLTQSLLNGGTSSSSTTGETSN